MGLQCLNGALSLDGTLNRKRKELRTQFFIFACVGWCASVLALVTNFYEQLTYPLAITGTLVVNFGFSIVICTVLCRVPLTTKLVVGPLYMITCGMLMWDLNGRAVFMNQWPLLVIIIDMLLVMQVPTRYSLGLVCFVVMWLMMLGLEESFRFGLFEMPGMPEQEGEFGRLHILHTMFVCEMPPCPVPFPSSPLLMS